jgi:hypothetical protein
VSEPTNPRVGDIGTLYQFTVQEDDVAVDLSALDMDTSKLRIGKPDGTVLNKTIVFDDDGTDGIVNYTIVSGDFDEAGEYTFELYLYWDAANVFRTSQYRERVLPSLTPTG